MKYTITIPEPCHENWHTMTPTQKGRCCDSCQKEVLDFTQTSTYKLAKILDNNGNICGRFRSSQLNKPFSSNQNSALSKTSLVFGVTSLLALCTPAVAQEKSPKIEKVVTTGIPLVIQKDREPSETEIVKGTVLDSDDYPLPGANILLEGSTIGTQTDFDGNFQLQIPKSAFQSNTKLVVTYIGFETKEICVNQLGPDIRLQLKLPMQEAFVGGIVVVRKRNIFSRIANLFRKKYHAPVEVPEVLSCDNEVALVNEAEEAKVDQVIIPSTKDMVKENLPKATTGVWPNPVSNEIKVKFTMEESGQFSIQLVPVYGMANRGKILTNEPRKQGEHEEVFDIGNVPNGLYALRLTKNNRVEEFKVLVEKK